jgi:3-hydroxypropanoate dehydrogenase
MKKFLAVVFFCLPVRVRNKTGIRVSRPVETLREAYELARMGPTSANSSPARFVFLQSEAAKARLLPALASPNVEKTRTAPVTVIVAWDTEFYEGLPQLFPHADMRAYFVGNQPLIDETAFRNGTLQGGYFILAARAVGLDCGPMSGFEPAKVNAEFFPNGQWKRTSCVILATAVAASCSRAIHDWSLTRRAGCCDVASLSGETRQAASLHHLFMRPISFRSFSLPSPRYLSAPRCG